jgi:aarF domain-containing kinase
VYAVKALYPKFDYQWLADEVSENLPRELDFANEAENCTRTQLAFADRPNVVTPAVFKECTSSRVLTMSFEEGVYSNDIDRIRSMNLNPADVASLIAEAFAEQIFVQGRVHCDPHFANMLIRPSRLNPRKPQLVLLDHGLYR